MWHCKKCTQKEKWKCKSIYVFGFIWISYTPINLAEWKWSKCTIFCSSTQRTKLTFIYSTILIAAWKRVLVKAKVKAIIQYHDNVAAWLKNKLKFMNCRSNYLKMFDWKLSLMKHAIYCTPISFRCVSRQACAIVCLKQPGVLSKKCTLMGHFLLIWQDGRS